MNSQFRFPLLPDICNQCKVLCWYTLRSNHHHHRNTLQCWLHHYKIYYLSMLMEHHKSDLQSIYTLYNIVYRCLIHSNHRHQSDTLHYLQHHHMVHLQSNLDHLSNLLVRKIEIYHDLFICAQKRVGLINGPQLFFHKYGPAAQTSPELIFHIIKCRERAFVVLSVNFI